MRNVYAASWAALLLLLLSGCQTPDKQSEAATVIRYACVGVDAAFFSFDAYDKAKPGKITAEQRRWRQNLPNLTHVICEHPENVVDRAQALDTLGKVTDALIDFVKGVSGARAP